MRRLPLYIVAEVETSSQMRVCRRCYHCCGRTALNSGRKVALLLGNRWDFLAFVIFQSLFWQSVKKINFGLFQTSNCQFSCVSSTIPKGLRKFQASEPLPTAGEGQEVAALQPDKALGAWEEKVPKGKQLPEMNTMPF